MHEYHLWKTEEANALRFCLSFLFHSSPMSKHESSFVTSWLKILKTVSNSLFSYHKVSGRYSVHIDAPLKAGRRLRNASAVERRRDEVRASGLERPQ